MYRKASTTRFGSGFDTQTIQAVWNKGTIIPMVDPNLYRKDACGALIERSQYGVTAENGTGWEIDHAMPVAQGGGDSLNNLQPMQWQNNRHKSDNWPSWSCLVVQVR